MKCDFLNEVKAQHRGRRPSKCKNYGYIRHSKMKDKREIQVEAMQVSIVDGCVNRMWCKRIGEYDSVLKRKESLTRATTQMNREDIMQSEISHT